MARVFRDRLTEEQDGSDFDTMLASFIVDGVDREIKARINTSEKIIFGDFIDKDNDNAKVYKEIDDINKLKRIFEDTLED